MRFEAKLLSERTELIPLAHQDFWFVFSLTGNKKVRRFLGGPVSWRRRLGRFFNCLAGRSSGGSWVVRDKTTRKRRGMVEVTPYRSGCDFEISYQFHPAVWGQGLAREAVATVVQHVFQDLDLQKIVAETQTANRKSCRLLEALGFVEQARLERFGALQSIFLKTKY